MAMKLVRKSQPCSQKDKGKSKLHSDTIYHLSDWQKLKFANTLEAGVKQAQRSSKKVRK